MTTLFQSHDSVHEILLEAGLQRINSDDKPLFESVSSVALPPLPHAEDDGNASTSEEPLPSVFNQSDYSEKFIQSMLDILAMKPIPRSTTQDKPLRKKCSSSSPHEDTRGQPLPQQEQQEEEKQGSSVTPSVTRSISGTDGDFMQNMLTILSSSKPTEGKINRSSSRTNDKRSLPIVELTSSKTWNNLGKFHDVDVESIFQTKQGDESAAMEDERGPVPTKSDTPSPHLKFCDVAENDVLLGRGGRSNNHHGNKRYLSLKDSMQDQYLTADKAEKKMLSQGLVNIIQQQWGGRFLKLDPVTKRWCEVDDETARKKCSQSLREINTPEIRAAKRAKYSR